MIEAAMKLMLAEIQRHGLEVIQRYPNDVLVLDRAVLEQYAHPGSTVAWMVGDTHSHIVPLGIHPLLNKLVTYLTNLASNDRFYALEFSRSGQFGIKPIDRKVFAELSQAAIPYTTKGTPTNFSLYREASRLGHCMLTDEGTCAAPLVLVTITPRHDIRPIDKAALEEWARQAVTKHTGTLFAKSKFHWNEPVSLAN